MNPRIKHSSILFCLGALLNCGPTRAADLPSDWQKEQSFELTVTGLVKVDLPVETLDSASPGLEDLRLYDDSGAEVPYLIEHPAPVTKTFESVKLFAVTLETNSTVITLETGSSTSVDGVLLQTPARDFIKAVDVEGSVAGSSWQPLAQGQPVFRQADGASQLHISVPAGAWARLRLTVDDRRSQPIPFTGAFVHVSRGHPAMTEAVQVAIAERDENPGETRLALNLGAANLSIASVRIDTSVPLFMRPVMLAEEQISENAMHEQGIARGTIYRVAVEGQTPSENLILSLESLVHSRELLVLINNGNNPPLAISNVEVERHPVYLVFLASRPGTYHLLSGNLRCRPPNYDLSGLGMNLHSVPVLDVKLPAPVDNPNFRTAQVLPGIGESGAPMDVSAWKFRKPVTISAPGVQQLDLDLDVLAHGTAEFADLRLLHGSNQVPYILDRTSISRSIAPAVAVTNDPQKQTVSRWIIKLPRGGLPLTRLTCSSRTPLFKRSLALYEMVTDEQGDQYRRDLGQANWMQTPEHPSQQFMLALDYPPQGDTMFLETENGDNPPIKLDTFQLCLPVTRVLFKDEATTSLHLYYGNPQAFRPDYDLSLVAGQLLSAEKNIATASAEEPLKKSGSHMSQMTDESKLLFWGMLSVVVVVLLAVISQLLPKPQPPQ